MVPWTTYGTASGAITGAKAQNAEYRAVSDEDVSGRRILRFCWTDSALALELDNGSFLNVTAGEDQVLCSLTRESAIGATESLQDDVLLDTGGEPRQWRRTEIAERYSGKVLSRLWFARTHIFIYAREMPLLILCLLAKRAPDGVPVLLWNESQ